MDLALAAHCALGHRGYRSVSDALRPLYTWMSMREDVQAAISTLYGIKLTRSSPYHPQSQGLVERANKTLQAAIMTYVGKDLADWYYFLPKAVFSMNAVSRRLKATLWSCKVVMVRPGRPPSPRSFTPGQCQLVQSVAAQGQPTTCGPGDVCTFDLAGPLFDCINFAGQWLPSLRDLLR